MSAELYQVYKAAIARGDRSAAGAAVKPFVASFESLEQRAAWTRWFLENEAIGHRVRHEIYEGVVFPVLLDGYRRSDPWCVRQLARTVGNLHQAESLWKQIGGKSEAELLRELQALVPGDDEARRKLLTRSLGTFHYQEHNWPWGGILYGHNGATPAECLEILEEVAFARTLDSEGRHAEYLDDFESKVREYQRRLEEMG